MLFIVLLAACLSVVSAASNCPENTDAWTSVYGPGSGGYWLMKTTQTGRRPCFYLIGSNFNNDTRTATYTYGDRDPKTNDMTKKTEPVETVANKIHVGDDVSQVIYTDGKTCDVMLHNNHIELWAHSTKTTGYNECCNMKFYEQLCGRTPNEVYVVYKSDCPEMPS